MEEKKTLKTICFHCGATNRFPSEALAQGKRILCGRCRNALSEPGMILHLTPERVYTLIRNGTMPILFEFYSENCPHCLRMRPILERLAKRRAGEIMVVMVNIYNYPELAKGFGVNSVPTFIIVKRGNEVDRLSGAQDEMDFSFWIASRT